MVDDALEFLGVVFEHNVCEETPLILCFPVQLLKVFDDPLWGCAVCPAIKAHVFLTKVFVIVALVVIIHFVAHLFVRDCHIVAQSLQ